MKFVEIEIGTARINGLNKPPYYFEHRSYYVWDIMFSDTSTLSFNHLTNIWVGDNKEEAEIFCNQIKEKFRQANICDGNKVAVIFGKDCKVRAIGCKGKDLWIDVNDGFTQKTFKELNIVPVSANSKFLKL